MSSGMFEEFAWAALISAVWSSGRRPTEVPGGWWVSGPKEPPYFLLKGKAPRHPALSPVEIEHRVTVEERHEIVRMSDALREQLEPWLKRQHIPLTLRPLRGSRQPGS